MWFRRRTPAKPLREPDAVYTGQGSASGAPADPGEANPTPTTGNTPQADRSQPTQKPGTPPGDPAPITYRDSSPSPVRQRPSQAPPQAEPLLFEVDPTLSSWLWTAAQARDLTPEELVAELLLRGLQQQAQRDRIETVLASLTPREREVVQLAARGLTNQQIAEALIISPETVKTHVRRALEKLGLQSKIDLRLLLLEGRVRWWKRNE
jgi:RNA polymerase sigma factor (sigma-70 family)